MLKMKRLPLFVSTFILLAAAMFNILPALAADVNLIANPSAETLTSTNTPVNWTQSKWGTNTTTFEHKNEGHTGTRSLYVSMTTRTDGDAKWVHDAVTIEPNTSYTYSSWYKSSVATEIDLQYTDASGNVSYAYVDSIPASSSWDNLSTTFTTPAGAKKVSVLHIVAATGWLQTDDFSLTKTTTTPPPTTPVDQDNLIANNSFETVSGTSPASWTKNNWGTNTTAFTYENTGRTGTRSAKVTMSAYTNGDAKWYANPVTVTPSKSYSYRDYYKSGVATRVVVAFIDASNNYTYQELAGAPAAVDWTAYNGTFTAPSTAVKATVYHIIDRVGSLTIDDVSLMVALPTTPPTTPTPPSGSITIPNSSLETANGSVPASWQKSSWGNNKPTFTYENTGRTGTKSAKVTMANFVDGDAKWFFDPINTLKPGNQYRFTTWYKTNVTPHPVAMFIMSDGSEQYFGMPVAQPASTSATTWQQYSDTFTVPAGAVSTSVFMFIDQNGWLQTDDYSLTDYSPNGFTRGLLTMTFDDGHEDNATTALPLLNQKGLKTTQCFATSFIEGQSQQVKNEVLAFKNSGHEICSHTVTHPFLTTVSPSTLTYEVQHSQQYLKTLTGTAVNNFASPYGDYNATVNTELKKYYRSHRTVDEGYNSKDNWSIYSLRVQNVLDTTTAEQITTWINQAKANKTWLILVYHRIADDPEQYDTYTSMFTQHVNAIVNSGITVKTTNAALDELVPQL